MSGTSDSFHALKAFVMKHLSRKTGKGSPDHENIVVDWVAVASNVVGGATLLDCQTAFINPPAEDVKIAISLKNLVFSHILDGVHPKVLMAVIHACVPDVDRLERYCTNVLLVLLTKVRC
jgi:hypothetical protein